MTALKNFLLGAIVAILIIFLLKSFICKLICTPCVEHVPNPTIEFHPTNNNNDHFGITVHAVPGATSANVRIIDQNGNQVGNASLAFETRKIFSLPNNAQRPVQLVFDYLSASNQIVAKDSLIIEDRDNGGTPPMEIVVGIVNGGQLNCPPNLTVSVTPTTISPVSKSFNWQAGKTYKISIDHGDVNHIILTLDAAGGNCHKAVFWKNNKYNCLSNVTWNQTTGSLTISTQNGAVIITGEQVCSNPNSGNILFEFDSPGNITINSD